MRRFLRPLGGNDRGSALVAAVAVAVIGTALSLVVVSRAMIVTNDAQRDKVRTSEIQSAEGALDAALFELEDELRCHGPSFTPLQVGTGTSAVEVAIEYEYYNDTTLLTACDGDLIDGTPTRAIVKATATPVAPTVGGTAPQRIIEAKIEIVPAESSGEQAAIFAGGTLTTTNPLTLSSSDPNLTANIRIEGNNATWSCQSGLTINGSVTVVRGSASFENSACRVTGDVWVHDNFTGKQPIGGGLANVGGNLTARYGNISLTNANYKFGGDVRAGGSTLGFHWGTASWAGTRCSANTTPCQSSVFGTDPVAVGIPEIDYVASDWTASGYTIKSRTDFENEWISQANTTQQWQRDAIHNANCNVGPWLFYNGATPRIDFNGGASSKTKSVYDLRTCSPSFQSVPFRLFADTALILKTFDTNGPTTFESGDGAPHTLYIIVPDGGTADNNVAECSSRGSYTPGNITLRTGVTVKAPITAIYYTPCDLTYTNKSGSRGQLFARNITINESGSTFEFVPVTVPGVQLGIPTTSSDNATIHVLYKHELSN